MHLLHLHRGAAKMRLTVAEIGYLSHVPWVVAGDRNSANCPLSPPAKLIKILQYLSTGVGVENSMRNIDSLYTHLYRDCLFLPGIK